ncbi:MAG: flippase [archaeon]
MNATKDSLKRMATGAGIIVFGILISKFFTYFYRLVVARIGATEYGLLSLAMAIFGFTAIVSLIGVDMGVLRYVSFFRVKKDYQKIKGTILGAFKISLILSFLIAFLLFILSDFIAGSFFHKPELAILLKIFAFAVPFQSLRAVFINTAKGFEKVQYEMYTKNIIENVLKVVLTLILLYFGFSVVGAALGYALALFVSMIFAVYFVQKKVFPVFSSKIKAVYSNKELVNYSWPLLFKELLVVIMLWTDTIMLGHFSTSAQVGIYNAAVPTAQMSQMIPYAIIVLFLPVASQLFFTNKRKDFENVFKTTTKWIFMLNIILTAGFVLFPQQILSILFGSEYAVGASTLTLLAIGYFIFYLCFTSREILLMVKRTRTVFFVTLFGTLLNVVLNYLLIPVYGIIGAAYATFLSVLLISVFMIAVTYNLTKVNPFKFVLIKIFFVMVFVCGVVKLFLQPMLGVSNFWSVMLGVIVVLFYALLLLETKCIDKEDKFIIDLIKQKVGLK